MSVSCHICVYIVPPEPGEDEAERSLVTSLAGCSIVMSQDKNSRNKLGWGKELSASTGSWRRSNSSEDTRQIHE